MTATIDRSSPVALHLAGGAAPELEPDRQLVVRRLGWSLVCLMGGLTGLQAWAGSVLVPGANIVSVALIAVSLWGLWVSWAATNGLGPVLQALILTVVVVGIAYYAAALWMTQPGYGTDAAAFDQYAASLVLHGHNPYTQSMAPSLAQFHVPQVFRTYRLDGSAVDQLSYPAASFLFYVPVMAAGFHTQAANVVDLAAWAVSGLLLWRMLPRSYSWAAGLIVSAAVYVSFMLGGLTDALFIPFVLGAVYRWDRYGDGTERGLARWIGPACLGVAASVKQTPWFLLAFLLIGIWIERRADGGQPLRTVTRYCANTLATFAVINAVFIAADPGAWARSVVLPLREATIPDGQGLIDLSIFNHLGGGRLQFYTYAAAGFAAAALVAYRLRYDVLKRAWVPLVAASFFLPTRSFGSYLFMLVPAAIVAGITARPAPAAARTRRRGTSLRLLLAATAIASVGATGVAIASPSPLSLRIVRTQSTGELGTIDQITVAVLNRTSRTQHPHFTVETQAHATTFWNALDPGGQVVDLNLPPHTERTVVLRAPNTASMPSITTPIFVTAFTTSPATMSTSASYLISRLSTEITPDAINTPVPVGKPVQLAVTLQDQYGNAVRRSGVTVTLGQVVYAPDGLLAGESSINAGPEGASPATATTDATGTARFIVVGDEAQPQPVFYEAWLSDDATPPHGYSNQVSIQYVARQ